MRRSNGIPIRIQLCYMISMIIICIFGVYFVLFQNWQATPEQSMWFQFIGLCVCIYFLKQDKGKNIIGSVICGFFWPIVGLTFLLIYFSKSLKWKWLDIRI